MSVYICTCSDNSKPAIVQFRNFPECFVTGLRKFPTKTHTPLPVMNLNINNVDPFGQLAFWIMSTCRPPISIQVIVFMTLLYTNHLSQNNVLNVYMYTFIYIWVIKEIHYSCRHFIRRMCVHHRLLKPVRRHLCFAEAKTRSDLDPTGIWRGYFQCHGGRGSYFGLTWSHDDLAGLGQWQGLGVFLSGSLPWR